jgi:hypothetical protein
MLLALIAVSGCAHTFEPPPEATFPDDLNKEAELRCAERRGGEQFVPNRVFRTDGCTLWPEGNWQACCVAHDIDYWCGGSAAERNDSDHALAACVAGKGHPIIGKAMGGVIHFTGTRLLPTPWRWGYGWPWLGAMRRSPEPADESN